MNRLPGRARLLVVLGVVAGCLLAGSAPAMGQVSEHVFAGSFGGGSLSAPQGVAVNEARSSAEGNVYVIDSEKLRRFKCDRSEDQSECELDSAFHEAKGFVKLPAEPVGIAIDNSTGPSAGDIYVALEEEKGVAKYDAAGEKLATFKGFKEEKEPKELFEEIHGVAVDASGNLYVYEGEAIIAFDNSEKNKFVSKLELTACEPALGFAAAPNAEAFYVGRLLESREPGICPEVAGEEIPVIAKVSAAEDILNTDLDRKPSNAVAVELYGGDAGDVYVDNKTSVAGFTPTGAFIERFGEEGEKALKRGKGLAVNSSDETIYVADSEANEVNVYVDPEGKPSVNSAAAENLTTTSERVTANIDPKGFNTEYAVQYGLADCKSNPCQETAPGSLLAGFGDQAVSVELTGLQPGTKYFFRVVATNSKGEAASASKTFKTLPSPAVLADGRAWELVTPSDKGGATALPITDEGGLIQSRVDGNAISYVTNAPVVGDPEGNRSSEPNQTIATRGSSEWSSRVITTANERGEGFKVGAPREYQGFSPDLRLSLVEPSPKAEPVEHPQLSDEAKERTIYRRDEQTCQSEPAKCFTPLVTDKNAKAGFGAKLLLLGSSTDLGHVVFESEVALTPEASTELLGLYEWEPATPPQLPGASPLKLVSILPNGEQAPAPELGNLERTVRNAVSSDGSRVFWTGLTEGEIRRLFMRDTVNGATVQIDKAQEGLEEPSEESEQEFQTANVDGTRVFFTNESPLNKESTLPTEAVEERGEGPDLYVCELPQGAEECSLADITAGSEQSADVQGVLGASEDGSDVYFVANGALAPGVSPGNCEHASRFVSTCNLYVAHYNPAVEGKNKWQITYIAALAGEDSPDWGARVNKGALQLVTSQVSPNGAFVAFMSNRSLTGYNNVDANPAAEGARDQEVFIYDKSADVLTCASCNPTGAQPHGVFSTLKAGEGSGLVIDRPLIWQPPGSLGTWLAANLPGWTAVSRREFARYQSRYLSDEGRLFFNSADALVPEDTNTRAETVKGKETTVGVSDVYEYEPAGIGGCQNEGCVSLVSSGKGAHESAFVDASVGGNDVFFVTSEPLVVTDRDSNYDLYDARVCGSAGCFEPTLPKNEPCLDANACQGGESPPPQFGPPLSSTFNGPGNSGKVEVRGNPEGGKPKPKTLTRKQKLKKALRTCRKKHKHNKKKRVACERQARKTYGAKKASKHHAKKGRR